MNLKISLFFLGPFLVLRGYTVIAASSLGCVPSLLGDRNADAESVADGLAAATVRGEVTERNPGGMCVRPSYRTEEKTQGRV